MSVNGHNTGRTNFNQLTPLEKKACFSLASIIALRMFGLFMIFPVLSLYIGKIEGATEITVGIAIGIYGLTQGLLQIPFGMLSDRFGRIPMIIIGLSLFILGSIIAAMSDSIWGIIVGRVIQGGGAIAAVIMALTADLTREETRTKALALVGATIGFAILVAFVVGPILNNLIAINGIFWLTAVLAAVGLFLILFVVPRPSHVSFHRDTETMPDQIGKVIRNGQLNRFNIGIFFLHAIFASSFIVVPVIINEVFKFDSNYYGFVLLGIMAASLTIMIPMIIIGESRRRMKQMFLLAIMILIVAHWSLAELTNGFASTNFHPSQLQIYSFIALLTLYFGAFNFLEAALPSLVSKTADPDNKGTAMGVYSSFQYFGTFAGGAAGGAIYYAFGFSGVFSFCLISAILWSGIAWSMKNPRYLRTQLLNVGEMSQDESHQLAMKLTAIQGVAEAVIVADEGIAYLKVDSKALDEAALFAYSKSAD